MKTMMLMGLVAAASIATVMAQEAPQVTVSYGDLNLHNHAGVRTLQSRIEAAAKSVCTNMGYGLQGYQVERACRAKAVEDAWKSIREDHQELASAE
jgi:UrcA family protein